MGVKLGKPLLTPWYFSIYVFPSSLGKKTQMESTLCHLEVGGEQVFNTKIASYVLPKKPSSHIELE